MSIRTYRLFMVSSHRMSIYTKLLSSTQVPVFVILERSEGSLIVLSGERCGFIHLNAEAAITKCGKYTEFATTNFMGYFAPLSMTKTKIWWS